MGLAAGVDAVDGPLRGEIADFAAKSVSGAASGTERGDLGG